MKKQKHQKQRVRPPSKTEMIMTATAHAYAHRSSDDANRRRIVLACEANTVDSEIVDLRAKMSEATSRKARLEAEFNALSSVVAARG
jgi:hypothetical protein